MLVEAGIISVEQLDAALNAQISTDRRIFDILIDQGALKKEVLHGFLSKQSGVPSIDLQNYDIPTDLIALVPKEFALANTVLPIDKLGRLLTVGMACPLDLQAIHELEQITGLRVKAMLCKWDDIHAMIRRCYPTEAHESAELAEYSLPEASAPAAAPTAAKRPASPAPTPAPAKPAPPPPAPPKAAPEAPAAVVPGLSAAQRDGLRARRKKTEEAIQAIEALPPMPKTVKEVEDAALDPDKTLRDVEASVRSDPCMAARLLALANASPYGLPGRVTDIALASAVLGVRGVSAIVAQAAATPVPELLRTRERGFWLRSVFCAHAAASVLKAAGIGQPADGYTAGLLHDIGRAALILAAPDVYAALDATRPIRELVHAEEDALGITHAEAGYLLARSWRFPGRLAEVIRFHHHPYATEADELISAVALGAFMAEVYERQEPISTDDFAQFNELLAFLNLDAVRTMMVYDKTADAFDKTRKKGA